MSELASLADVTLHLAINAWVVVLKILIALLLIRGIYEMTVSVFRNLFATRKKRRRNRKR
ncbi:hypothetical protein CYR55_22620 [Chimaeribacter californicus]|uniref:Uncharacterized protein n=1 Tax=Chimaeribacter californicus TaxID=2060067 RepID=A0A2N5DTG8_9GAMM|nr:hypothetical protein CYR55_22620 [Chimaeribacter californicus]